MSDLRITDEATEAAAHSLRQFDAEGQLEPGELGLLLAYRDAARGALEAAVPLLAPQPAVDREAEGLEALHLDICRIFGAVESPSLDQLEAMLLKRGWVRREEVAQAIEAERAEDDRDEGDDFHRSIHFATCAQIARSAK